MTGAANGYVAGQIYYDAIMVSMRHSILWGCLLRVAVQLPSNSNERCARRHWPAMAGRQHHCPGFATLYCLASVFGLHAAQDQGLEICRPDLRAQMWWWAS